MNINQDMEIEVMRRRINVLLEDDNDEERRNNENNNDNPINNQVDHDREGNGADRLNNNNAIENNRNPERPRNDAHDPGMPQNPAMDNGVLQNNTGQAVQVPAGQVPYMPVINRNVANNMPYRGVRAGLSVQERRTENLANLLNALAQATRRQKRRHSPYNSHNPYPTHNFNARQMYPYPNPYYNPYLNVYPSIAQPNVHNNNIAQPNVQNNNIAQPNVHNNNNPFAQPNVPNHQNLYYNAIPNSYYVNPHPYVPFNAPINQGTYQPQRYFQNQFLYMPYAAPLNMMHQGPPPPAPVPEVIEQRLQNQVNVLQGQPPNGIGAQQARQNNN